MNNLSWMLYLAEICGNLRGVFIFLSVVGGVYVGGLGLGYVIADYDEDKTSILRGLKFILPCLFLVMFLGAILPSKQTIYMIIASEAGEEVAQSETGKKALEAVNHYLDSIGVEEKKEENNDK